MDSTAFRWVLIIIAVILALAIYFFGQHQARLRKRSAMDTFTREEIDSAFIEDEQLRFELNNLNHMLQDNEIEENLDDIEINPAQEAQQTPFALPDPEVFVPGELAAMDPERLVSYHLRHGDFRMIPGAEVGDAVAQAGLELDDDGYLVYREEGEVAFRVASLSPPGDFSSADRPEFSTLGCNCFIDLERCDNPRIAYEAMLKKIDELVRMLNVKVYKPSQELLTISDVTAIRQSLN